MKKSVSLSINKQLNCSKFDKYLKSAHTPTFPSGILG